MALACATVLTGCGDDSQRDVQTTAARAACVQLATDHLKSTGRFDEHEFGQAANVSSDPETDAFEFLWKFADGTMKAKSQIAGEVLCRGYARLRVITFLVVDRDVLASAKTY
jgi:hypothetical protein